MLDPALEAVCPSYWVIWLFGRNLVLGTPPLEAVQVIWLFGRNLTKEIPPQWLSLSIQVIGCFSVSKLPISSLIRMQHNLTG